LEAALNIDRHNDIFCTGFCEIMTNLFLDQPDLQLSFIT